MSELPDRHAMPAIVRWLSAILAVSLGAGYAFGPSAIGNAEVFKYARELMPVSAWGFLFIVCGSLLIIPRSQKIVGHATCAILWTLWAIFLLLGSVDAGGGLAAWGAFIWPSYFAAINYMHVWLWGRHRGQRLREQRG